MLASGFEIKLESMCVLSSFTYIVALNGFLKAGEINKSFEDVLAYAELVYGKWSLRLQNLLLKIISEV